MSTEGAEVSSVLPKFAAVAEWFGFVNVPTPRVSHLIAGSVKFDHSHISKTAVIRLTNIFQTTTKRHQDGLIRKKQEIYY